MAMSQTYACSTIHVDIRTSAIQQQDSFATKATHIVDVHVSTPKQHSLLLRKVKLVYMPRVLPGFDFDDNRWETLA